MTIVHIGPPHLPILYNLGGATERRMREVAARQAQQGSRVIVYSAEDQNRSTEYFGAEIRGVECRRQGILRAAEFLTKSLRDVKRVAPEVIHFHGLAEGAAFANLFARGINAKTFLSFDYFIFRRGKENPFFPWYQRALRSFSSLLPVSDYCRRESAAYWSIPEDRMQVLYNGVSLQQFHPDAAAAAGRRAALGIGDEFVLVYVGRVCQQKGTDLLVDAYAKLRAEGRKIRLVIAGPIGQFGHEGSDEITNKLKANEGLYLGPVDEAVLPSVYNMADVFVLPTRDNEMFGMAAIEAQACGRPVVCSNHGGLPEVVDRSSGLLFRSGDREDLTQQLRVLMDNSSMRQQFSEAAVTNARRFAWESITKELGDVYRAEPRH
ncbi:MAG: glycosyltransferase family 4 protein [Acidobacteria bacterium]|nr:glycosyltransferase family 4 protein [Acidobacteriota bacterium]